MLHQFLLCSLLNFITDVKCVFVTTAHYTAHTLNDINSHMRHKKEKAYNIVMGSLHLLLSFMLFSSILFHCTKPLYSHFYTVV